MDKAEWPLVGRDEESALLSNVVGGASGSLVVAGEMGVGKSRLVTDLLGRGGRSHPGGDAASEHGVHRFRVVEVRATRSTATIPFGPFAAWAPGSSRQTGDRLGALQVISRGLLEGDDDRVVVVVDDAHLLDDGSAALVLHLVVQTSASVVATVRSGEPCPDAITALWKDGLAQRVDLQALSYAETVDLVGRVLGGPLDLFARRRIWALTEGVPLYLREVVRAALAAGVLTLVDGVWRWQGELAVGGRLADLVGDRLAQAGEEERQVLELLAFGEPVPVGIVDEAGLRDALGSAERHGLVEVDGGRDLADDPTVRLVHPLYAEVLRATVPTLAAQDLQRRLAAGAAAIGWHEHDPLRVASWWLESGSTPDAPGIFLTAAWRALALAEWELAERMAHAAERSGAGPPATLIRSTALDVLGRWEQADELLSALSYDGLDDELVAQVATARAGLVLFDRGQLDTALEILAAAADRLAGSVRAGVVAQAGYLAVSACQPGRALTYAEAALEDAGSNTEVRVEAIAVATLAWALQGETSAAITAAELALPYVPEVVATDPSPVALNAIGVLPVAYAIALVVAGRLDEASAIAAATMQAASESDFRILHGMTAALDGRMALHRGRPALTRERGEEGLAIVRELRVPFEWPAAIAAMGAAQLGDVATARAALAWLDEARRPPAEVYDLELRQGRAWLAAAQGELSSARAQLEAVVEMAEARGAALFELLALIDVARLGGEAQAAPRLVALADRVEGDLPAAAATFASALAAFDAEALDTVSERFEVMGFELLAAEAAAAAAAAHRTAGRRGSHLTAFTRARLLRARCDDARTPALGDLDAEPALATLTSREREVCELAARGLSNRAIADRLFVSVRTVHSHLQSSYTKLGVNDRDQLGSILSGPGQVGCQ